MAKFGATFGNFGLLFALTFGHTGSSSGRCGQKSFYSFDPWGRGFVIELALKMFLSLFLPKTKSEKVRILFPENWLPVAAEWKLDAISSSDAEIFFPEMGEMGLTLLW